jgi:hypothetical protein
VKLAYVAVPGTEDDTTKVYGPLVNDGLVTLPVIIVGPVAILSQ